VGHRLAGRVDSEDAARLVEAVGVELGRRHREVRVDHGHSLPCRAPGEANRRTGPQAQVSDSAAAVTYAAPLMALDLRSPTIRKLAKYSTASVVAVSVGQPVLWICFGVLDWAAVPANLASVTAGAVPNYLINRRWTWRQTGKNRLWGEVVPFWVMSVLGMLLSLWAVSYAERRWDTTIAVAIAQLTGFGVLWLAKFLVLDKVMWRIVHELQPDVAIDEASAGLVGALSLDGTRGEPPTPDQLRSERERAERQRAGHRATDRP